MAAVEVLDQRDITALRAGVPNSIEERWGGVDIVFANAGIPRPSSRCWK